MSLFSKFFGGARGGHTVVFDIGSATVGISLVKLSGSSAPKILYLQRNTIDFEEGAGLSELAKSLGNTIIKSGDELQDWLSKNGSKLRIRNVHAIIHAPWANSNSKRSASALAQESTITEEILRQFIEREFEKEPQEGRITFDRHVSSIELNGYNTKDPYGKSARDLAVVMLSSAMPETVHEEVIGAIKDVFPEQDVHIDAFIRSTTQYARKLMDADEYTLIDVGGEYTTLNVIRGTSIAQSTRVQLGTLELLRGASGADAADEAATSALIMYLSNTCTPSQCRKVEKLLEATGKKWHSAFKEALEEAVKDRALPAVLFVSVDSRFYPWFEKFFKKDDFSNYTTTKRPFSPQLIRVQGNERPINLTGKLPDNQLMLATFFASHSKIV